MKRAFLPYDVQLHRDETESHYYIVNAWRLIPCEEPVVNEEAVQQLGGSGAADQQILDHLALIDSFGRQLRPELALYNHNNVLARGIQYFTWTNPISCSECGKIIQEY